MKHFLAILCAVALTGCATNQQAGLLTGAAVGAATGKVLAGEGGATVGALIGAAIGENVGASMDNSARLSQAPAHVDAPGGVTPASPPIRHYPPRDIFHGLPPGIVYVHPYYPSPGLYWGWGWHSYHGWGWYHRHHGWYHRHHHRHWRHGR